MIMETGLRGRNALVTGAASGIGRAIAIALAGEGAHVIIADLDEQGGHAVAAQIIERGGSARAVGCDVVDEATVEVAVMGVLATEGQLDVMVNNAGIGTPVAPIIESQAADWDRVLAVNLRGVFFGIKHAARAMLQSGGSIVNIASIAGIGASPMIGPYGAAKAGVIQLTHTAAIELAGKGIRVNAVCPGWTETPLLGGFEHSRLAAQVPIGRIAQPEEIANMVVYLASDAAAFVTGSAFRIDGGTRS
jgi:NAD(P)-dependent dehydrogenase (short-subunit alcohol dehydrogenase family)